jgi:hypothetical protein
MQKTTDEPQIKEKFLLRFFKKIHHKIIIQENIHTYNKKLS